MYCYSAETTQGLSPSIRSCNDVEIEKISAKVEDGILTEVLLKVEKEEKKTAKSIEVH